MIIFMSKCKEGKESLSGYIRAAALMADLDDRYTPDGVVATDDMYLHSARGFTFLCDATGFLACPPTPEHAHDVEQHYSELHPCEREDMFDVYE